MNCTFSNSVKQIAESMQINAKMTFHVKKTQKRVCQRCLAHLGAQEPGFPKLVNIASQFCGMAATKKITSFLVNDDCSIVLELARR